MICPQPHSRVGTEIRNLVFLASQFKALYTRMKISHIPSLQVVCRLQSYFQHWHNSRKAHQCNCFLFLGWAPQSRNSHRYFLSIVSDFVLLKKLVPYWGNLKGKHLSFTHREYSEIKRLLPLTHNDFNNDLCSKVSKRVSSVIWIIKPQDCSGLQFSQDA